MIRRILIVLVILLCVAAGTAAETSRNIADECTYLSKKKSGYNVFHDDNYATTWKSEKGHHPYLEVHLPEGETCQGVQIKWYAPCKSWSVQIEKDGAWVAVDQYREGEDYLVTWSSLPSVNAFRIACDFRVANWLRLNEIYVMTEGDLPDWIQRWEPTYEKADLMLVVAHPDDEYVFMGGMIPYYGAEKGKKVLVVYVTESSLERRVELLDGLWMAGQRSYPLIGKFYDRYTMSMDEAYKKIGKNKVTRYMAELFRYYRPEVVVTHDFSGEYGHGVHKVCADVVSKSLKNAANPKYDPKTAKAYGTWDVPKCYIHLYEKGQLILDWDQRLENFGGRTGYEVAMDAFRCHRSQQRSKYTVYMDGPYDSRVFGLYRSLVGPDLLGNDLFENIPSGEDNLL